MKVNTINFNNNTNNNRKTSFKSRFLVDVGGSVGENSLKALIIPNNSSETIFKMKDVVNTQGKRIYQDAEDFLKKLASKMATCYKKGLAKNPEDKIVSEAVFFMPGTIKDNSNILLYADNIRNAEGVGMEGIDFDLIAQYLRENGVQLAKDFKVKACQDSMGSGLVMGQKLLDKGMYHEGDDYIVAITGGGCGLAYLSSDTNKFLRVLATGSGCSVNNHKATKLSHEGASVSELIKNFCNAFDIDKRTGEQIAKCGIGQVVSSEIFMIPKNAQGKRLKELLLSLRRPVFEKDAYGNITNRTMQPVYELYDENSIRVTDSFSEDFKLARYSAIDKYAMVLKDFFHLNENKGVSGFIITGPLSFAMDKALRKHHGKSLAELVARKIKTYNSHELDLIGQDLKVICNPEFSMDDNTEARELAFKAVRIGKHSGKLRLQTDKILD